MRPTHRRNPVPAHHRNDGQRLHETIERIEPCLLVLDPLVRLRGVDENAVAEPARWAVRPVMHAAVGDAHGFAEAALLEAVGEVVGDTHNAEKFL